MKKKSPVVEMTSQILDEIQEHNTLVSGHKDSFIQLLKQIEWNLLKAQPMSNANTAQALGYCRGALMMFGEKPQVSQ